MGRSNLFKYDYSNSRASIKLSGKRVNPFIPIKIIGKNLAKLELQP